VLIKRGVADEKALGDAFIDDQTAGIEALRTMRPENCGILLRREDGIRFAV